MMTFSTQNLTNVFSEEGKYENFKKLCFNLLHGEDIYEVDENGRERRMSAAEANRAVRKVFMDICGLSEDDLKSNKTRRRAEKDHQREIFEIIEEEIDFKINEGFAESEWFNKLVEAKNLKLGDANEFKSHVKQLFIVGDYSGDNHDITMQQLAEGETFLVKTSPKTVKIGKDIDLIILGRIDFSDWIAKIAESYIQYVQKMIYAQVTVAVNKLPSQYKDTGALSAATKQNFDDLLDRVAVANGSDVVIMATKSALKKISNLADVQWASDAQKQQMNNYGRLGIYEGTTLIEIPQKLDFDRTTRLMSDKQILMLPVTDDRFIKFVDEGETEIFEVNEKAQLVDDFDTYEVSRRIGADVVLGQYFGCWTLP